MIFNVFTLEVLAAARTLIISIHLYGHFVGLFGICTGFRGWKRDAGKVVDGTARRLDENYSS